MEEIARFLINKICRISLIGMFPKIVILAVLIFSCGLPPQEKAMSILKNGLDDKSSVVRVNAAKGLAVIGDGWGYEVLYKILQGEEKEAIVSALIALRDLKEKSVAPIILKLCSSNDPLIRTEAYHLLATIPDTAGYKILVQGTTDKIARVRRYAYQGLERFKDSKRITQGLKDTDPIVRIYAARSLGLLGDREAKEFIKKEMDPKNPNPDVWAQAAIALAELNDTLSIPYIKELLTDTPWDLRIGAAHALLIFRNPEGIRVLKEGLKSADPFVRVKSVEVIKEFPLLEFYEVLKDACKDEYINVSVNAIEALRFYGKKENLSLFEKLFSAPNPLVRIAAATAYLSQTRGDR